MKLNNGFACRIKGSDGSIFPPNTIRQKKLIDVYQKDMCRRLPFVFGEEVKLFNGKVPAYRFANNHSIIPFKVMMECF